MPSHLPWWPAAGPIDLAVHDLPHAAADTEWWYVNTHVRTADGRELRLVRRVLPHHQRGKTRRRAGRVRALDDLGASATSRPAATSASRASTSAPAARPRAHQERARLEGRAPQPRDAGDPRARQRAGARPRVRRRRCTSRIDRLALQLRRVELREAGRRQLPRELVDHDGKHGCELMFAPQKPADAPRRRRRRPRQRRRADVLLLHPALRGDRQRDGRRRARRDRAGPGLVRSRVRRLRRAGAPNGRQTSRRTGEGAGIRDLGWNWTAVQLDDGTDLTAYEIVDVKTNETVGKWVIRDRHRRHAPLDPRRHVRRRAAVDARRARSTTIRRSWRLRAPRGEARSARSTPRSPIRSSSPCISKPAFWEGRCSAQRHARRHATSPASATSSAAASRTSRRSTSSSRAVGDEVRSSIGGACCRSSRRTRRCAT